MINNENKYSMYISLSAPDIQCLEGAVIKMVLSVKQAGIDFKGPVCLPTQKTDFTLNRAPHIDKKSREQFEMAIHKRMVVLCNIVSAETMQTLIDASFLSIGVEISLKVKRS